MNDRQAFFDYIATDNPRAAARVNDRIEVQMEALILTPEIGRPGRIAGTRELVIVRTPYLVAYTIERDMVRVLRVLHGAQEWPDEIEQGR